MRLLLALALIWFIIFPQPTAAQVLTPGRFQCSFVSPGSGEPPGRKDDDSARGGEGAGKVTAITITSDGRIYQLIQTRDFVLNDFIGTKVLAQFTVTNKEALIKMGADKGFTIRITPQLKGCVFMICKSYWGDHEEVKKKNDGEKVEFDIPIDPKMIQVQNTNLLITGEFPPAIITKFQNVMPKVQKLKDERIDIIAIEFKGLNKNGTMLFNYQRRAPIMVNRK